MIPMAGGPRAASASTLRLWVIGNGDWSDANGWSPAGVPAAGDLANIENNDGITRTVTYDYAGPAVTLAQVMVDQTGGTAASPASDTLAISANWLSGTLVVAGYAGVGIIAQSGGSVAVGSQLQVG